MSESKTFTVTTPNPHFKGFREGVLFDKGKAVEVDRESAERLVTVWGYSCPEIEEELAAASAAEKEEIKRPAKDATNDELRAFLDDHDIAYESDDNKPDLNAKIDDWLEKQTETKE